MPEKKQKEKESPVTMERVFEQPPDAIFYDDVMQVFFLVPPFFFFIFL